MGLQEHRSSQGTARAIEVVDRIRQPGKQLQKAFASGPVAGPQHSLISAMTSRKALRGALNGFLGTYISRYSDYQGYWLFGQSPESDLKQGNFDLLESGQGTNTPSEAARSFAGSRFREQVAKASLSMDVVSRAELCIKATDEYGECRQGDFRSRGRRVIFEALVCSDTGQTYRACCSAFIAPHDPDKERPRHVDSWGA